MRLASPNELKKIQDFYGKYSKTFIDSDKKGPFTEENKIMQGESTDTESPEIRRLKAPKKEKILRGQSPFADERLQKLS